MTGGLVYDAAMTIFSRRNFLGGALGALCLPACAWAVTPRPVTDFRRAGDPDDSAAFARALAAGGPIHVPAGRGSGPGGAYLVGDVAPRAGSVITGDGSSTVIRPSPGSLAAFFCDSGSARSRIAGLQFRDLTLEGWSRERGFAEHYHLLNLAGVENVVIERVTFRAFQGDGLILSSGRVPGTERHNRAIVVRDCIFDGVNRQNRNAISVIDVDGLRIEGCQFRSCTRPDMPGAIDVEPDANAFAVIRSIAIVGCRFANIGGNVGMIGFHIPGAVRAVPSGIEIEGNSFESYAGTGAAVYVNLNRRPPAGTNMAMQISNNTGSNGAWVYHFYAAAGIRTSGNVWQDFDYGALLGFHDQQQLLRDAAIADSFVRCGLRNKVGMYVIRASGLDLAGSSFVDCGDGSANAYAISFAQGESDHVSLSNVRVSAPTGRTRRAVVREAGHVSLGRTNTQRGNDYGGLAAASILD